jgi:NAD(P)-dependent dehydrogenase (short-subunit alcohol dehydrogenase family)
MGDIPMRRIAIIRSISMLAMTASACALKSPAATGWNRRNVLTGANAAAMTTLSAIAMTPLPAVAASNNEQLLSGTTVLLTGRSELSIETGKALSRQGARVVITARLQRQVDDVVDACSGSGSGSGSVLGVQLDLANLTDVRSFPRRLDETLGASSPPAAIDVLICSAQGESPFNSELTRTLDGIERHIGVSHIGHFALVAALLPNLQAARDGFRVLSISNEAHRGATRSMMLGAIDEGFDIPPGLATDTLDRYRIAKAANVLFALELQRRLTRLGLRGSAEAVGLEDPRVALLEPLEPATQTLARLSAGADSGFSRAATPEALYYRGSSGESAVAGEAARDAALAIRLWQVSERLSGVSLLRMPEA